MLTYKGEYLSEISFPLGGIGAGSVGLAGNGQLIDWEIFNRPNKCSDNGYSHFAIKAENNEKVIDARVLNGDVTRGYMGVNSSQSTHCRGYGHGVNSTTMQGIVHFSDVTFDGKFPIAKMNFKEEKFPADIQLTAFNPFVPSDDKNSSIPSAFFEWEITNNSDEELRYTIAFTCRNTFSNDGINEFVSSDEISRIRLYNLSNSNELQISTDCNDISYTENWFRGGWFDGLTTFWREFSSFGNLKNRSYEPGSNDLCTLEAHIKLKPNEIGKIRFVLSWYFPVFKKYWDSENPEQSWKNYYATIFNNCDEVTNYSIRNFSGFLNKTKLFADTLYKTTMPEKALEAVGSNLAILKSSTCMRLEDGTFYAFEGANTSSGSCEGSCTHVWNYAYALPFLFPALERSMRDADYKYNCDEHGGMHFRTQLPLGCGKLSSISCVDGQYGGIIKLYRDWKISGDDDFLKRNWVNAKRSIEYAWNENNPYLWDPEQTGIITGRQHHTLDMELFGANAWLSGFYITALVAGAEICDYLGEKEDAEKYRKIAEKGKKYLNTELFNGSHYIQKIDLNDKAIIDRFYKFDDRIYDLYWLEEKNEIKYQIKDGCGIDQMLAQWHSDICGLGEVFDEYKAKIAAITLYNSNFKSMRDISNPCRIFALNDEKGILICNWDDKYYKPQIPITYAEELMTGFEYAASIMMLKRGLVDEGFECIEAIRDRYDGKKRNPYSEIECGSSYARATASYSLIPVLSGFKFDKVNSVFGFDPMINKDNFFTFWSVDNAWGDFKIKDNNCFFETLYGEIKIKKFTLPDDFISVFKVMINDENINFTQNDCDVIFEETLTLTENDILTFIK